MLLLDLEACSNGCFRTKQLEQRRCEVSLLHLLQAVVHEPRYTQAGPQTMTVLISSPQTWNLLLSQLRIFFFHERMRFLWKRLKCWLLHDVLGYIMNELLSLREGTASIKERVLIPI